jgi:hypothetical protein
MTTIQVFRLIAPEFKPVGDGDLADWIELVKPYISKKVFGKFYDQALAYLAAHKMKLAGLGDDTYGTVAESMRLASVSEGDSSISFNSAQAPTTTGDSEYLITPYGVQFVNIKRYVIIPIHVSGEESAW